MQIIKWLIELLGTIEEIYLGCAFRNNSQTSPENWATIRTTTSVSGCLTPWDTASSKIMVSHLK